MKHLIIILLCSFLIIGCNRKNPASLYEYAIDVPSIQGKELYLNSPYVTAGNRVYMVGHQDGSFPEIGWHIKGEMGGIWNHPIKLMDGFVVNLDFDDTKITLNKAKSFTNYPMASKHVFSLDDKNIEIERWQFVPDNTEGIAIQFLIKNRGDISQNFKLSFIGNSDLRPTWLGERSNMVDHQDMAEYHENHDAWIVKDSLNPWFVVFGSDLKSVKQNEDVSDYSGNGLSNSLTYDMSIAANETKALTFTVAGSFTSKENAVKTYGYIQNNLYKLFVSKQDRYKKLASQTKLTVPDKELQQTFEWLKYNCDWLVRTVPEIGTGIGAGIPDYPWWFGVDSEYALKGYMAIGQKDVVYKTIKLLDSLSDVTNGNGRIIHEVSTNGVVFNEGNINETPQFASLIWEIYKWNGDKEFLKKYFPTIKKGLDWLMTEKDADKNLFPDGFGMMEIHGLDSEMIDVAAYTQRAFDDASKMALELEDEELAESYSKIAKKLKNKINEQFWSEEFQSYADFIGTDQQALHLIEDAIIRADTLNKPWAVEELKQTKAAIKKNPSSKSRPFVLHHNWVVNTPMEMAIADSIKAIQALKTAEQFVNPFGVFVTGIDRDESAGSDDGSFKGSKIFSYTGAVMTLPTGVQTIAENNYGRPDKALNYLKRMTRTFSYALPGSMYEVSPDYGMMTQAWNIYSFAVPIVHQFFGIQPLASRKRITISPQMPSEWNEASLEDVEIADNKVSVFYKKYDNKLSVKVTQINTNWELSIILPKQEKGNTWEVLKSSAEASVINNNIIVKSDNGITEVLLQKK